jgi:hypothetical protein
MLPKHDSTSRELTVTLPLCEAQKQEELHTLALVNGEHDEGLAKRGRQHRTAIRLGAGAYLGICFLSEESFYLALLLTTVSLLGFIIAWMSRKIFHCMLSNPKGIPRVRMTRRDDAKSLAETSKLMDLGRTRLNEWKGTFFQKRSFCTINHNVAGSSII